jgi:threonine/homoserine/homoserine lactone efflux protein
VTIEFLLTSLIIIVTPGTGVLYTLAAGLSRGARASVIAAIGCTFGIVPHMVAAIIGVAYLLYMAWSTLRDKDALTAERDAPPKSATRVIVSGVLINILNPKLTIFFFAFLPQFIGANETNALPHMIELSLVFMLLTFVIFVGYGVFAAAARNHVISRPRVLAWMRRLFAGAFVALGARLLTS